MGDLARLRNKYAIVGLGVTKMGKLPEYTEQEVARWALDLALDDAGLQRKDIDGFLFMGGLQGNTYDGRFLGISPRIYWSMMTGGGSTPSGMVIAAIGAIETGQATHVVCIAASRYLSAGARLGSHSYGIGQVWGLHSPIASFALHATRHMHEYGTTSEHLGMVAVVEREYACMRPEAIDYGHPLTLDDYFSSPRICHPFRRLDCTRDADGGVAVIVTTAERARDLKGKPVHVMGMGSGHNLKRWHDKSVYLGLDVARAKETAFGMAGVDVKDVDVFECYDAFTINVIMQLEGYGFCGEGEGGPFVAAGETRLAGSIPTNTAGGQLSGWYLTGFTPMTEGIRQLRGEGGESQVKDAEVAVVTGHGGNAGVQNTWAHTCLVLGR